MKKKVHFTTSKAQENKTFTSWNDRQDEISLNFTISRQFMMQQPRRSSPQQAKALKDVRAIPNLLQKYNMQIEIFNSYF